jgi:membrane-bound ClpP family serine protease
MEQNSLSLPLLVVLVSWLTVIFIGFGLFGPRNYTVIVTLVACALAVSGAIFIILEMYTPFSGIMKISPSPMHYALSQMGS